MPTLADRRRRGRGLPALPGKAPSRRPCPCSEGTTDSRMPATRHISSRPLRSTRWSRRFWRASARGARALLRVGSLSARCVWATCRRRSNRWRRLLGSPRRADALDQARRLHRALATGGKQDAQARIPRSRRSGARRRHADHPGRPVIQSTRARRRRAAAKLGLKCVLVLEERVSQADRRLSPQRQRAARPRCSARLEVCAARQFDDGGRANWPPTRCDVPAASPMSSRAAARMPSARWAMSAAPWKSCSRRRSLGVRIDRAVHATEQQRHAGRTRSPASTACEAACACSASPVGRPRDNQERNVGRLLDETWAHLGMKGAAPRDNIEANDNYFGEAYGIPTPAMKEAVGLLAETEARAARSGLFRARRCRG